MRSKKVEKAIKVMQKDIKDYKAELEIELEDRIDEQRIAYLHQQTTSYETVLTYIKQLEELPNKIRDKIKELKDREEELSDEQGYWGGQALLDKIEFLEELLGE